MKIVWVVICAAILALSGCGERVDEVSGTKAVKVSRTEADWAKYFTAEVNRQLPGASNAFVYTLPDSGRAHFEAAFKRQLENASADVERGIVGNTLVAFCAPDSAKGAELAVAALARARPGKFNSDVRVLFFGSRKDSSRVEAAALRSGAKYVFVET